MPGYEDIDWDDDPKMLPLGEGATTLPEDVLVARWWAVRRRVANAPTVARGALGLLCRSAALAVSVAAGGGAVAAGIVALLRRSLQDGVLTMTIIGILSVGGAFIGGALVMLCVMVAERWQRQDAATKRADESATQHLVWPPWKSVRVILNGAVVSKAGPVRIRLTLCNISPLPWRVVGVHVRHLHARDGALRTLEAADTFAFSLPAFNLPPGRVLEISGYDTVRSGDLAGC